MNSEVFKNIYTGTDIEEIKRFETKTLQNDSKFLGKIFTQDELEYCFSNKFPAPHLTARFCAKESIIKALYSAGITGVYYSDIEISHDNNGCPIAEIKKCPNVSVKISVSHTKDYAIANVIVYVG